MDLQAVNNLYKNDFPNIQMVLGEGNINAAVMLIGEAPGREEIEKNRPFVGKAGKNLTEFLQLINLCRQDIFITNTVKFRPVKVSVSGGVSNRPPSLSEINQFMPYLKREVAAVNPKLVVTMGNTALQALIGRDITIGKVHGQLLELGERKLFPLFHPASIIYNPQLKSIYTSDIFALKDVISVNGYCNKN